MVALTKDRNTHKRLGEQYEPPVDAAVKIFGGSIVMLSAAGNAAPATAASELTVAGVSQEYIDNSAGAAGTVRVKVERGKAFLLENDGGITVANIGDTAFAVDDQTVSVTATSRSPVGRIVDVDADGVWVFIPEHPFTPRAANADTSGLAVAALETEVNELKAVLRDAGLIAA